MITQKVREIQHKEIFDANQANFREKYGISWQQAEQLFKDGVLAQMLNHMYNEAMAELRCCDMDADGKRIQGTAVALYALLDSQKEAIELRNQDK